MSKARDIADLDFNSPDIDGGNIDGATIGGTTPAAGSFSALTVDTMTLNASSITGTSNLTLDVAGDINLDADGGDIVFKDGGTEFGSIGNASGSMFIEGLPSTGKVGLTFFGNYIEPRDNGSSSDGAVDLGIAGARFRDIHLSGSIKNTSDITIDAAGDIVLDADGGDIVLKDGGSQFGLLTNDNFTLKIQNHAQDTDISFVGNDGGSLITALNLDMSAAGAATFNSSVAANKISILAADGVRPNDYVASFQNQEATDSQSFGVSIAAGSTGSDIAFNVVDHDASNVLLRVLGNGATTIGGAATFSSNITLGSSTAGNLEVGSANSLQLQKSGVNGFINQSDSGPLIFRMGSGFAERFRIASDGGITHTSVAGGHVRFNSGVIDSDFTVSSDGYSHMLHVDGANNQVNIGTASNMGGLLNVRRNTANAFSVYFENLNASGYGQGWNSVSGHQVFMYHGNAHVGGISSASNFIKYSTSSSADLKLQAGGTREVVVNDDGTDTNFRVESDTNSHMLFVDGGNNFVSIGSANTSRQVVDNATATLRVEHGINAVHTLTNSGNGRDIINIDTPGSWAQTGNTGTVSSLSWTNAPGNMMGRIGLQYGGTQTGGNSEFVIKDLYQSGFGNSGDVVRFGSNTNTRFYGSVGIGTAPSYPLHIYDPTPRIQLHDSSSGGTAYLNLDGTEATLRNNSTNGALKLVTNNPRANYLHVNEVADISESFHVVNNVQYDFEYTVPSEGGAGNSFFIIAGYNHFYTTQYGAHRVAFMSARTTSMNAMINLGNQTSTGGGEWQFTKPNATTLRIRKTAGTYVGGGSGFIKVFFRNAIG